VKGGLLAPYELSLRSGRPLDLVDEHGLVEPLNMPRWRGPADPADHTVLRRCTGPVLDLGCGPGRLVTALSAMGIPALGVDLAGAAVQLTRERGAAALHRDLFARLPGERRWPTVLLLDGNIGIGADPVRLLARVERLLAHDGCLLVEADPDDRDDRVSVRFAYRGRPVGPLFRWAHVGLSGLATAGPLRVVDAWCAAGRVFAVLRR
jgi:SAM-dependent methyltransferase